MQHADHSIGVVSFASIGANYLVFIDGEVVLNGLPLIRNTKKSEFGVELGSIGRPLDVHGEEW